MVIPVKLQKYAAWLVGASAGVAIGKALKNSKICPTCAVKKALAYTQVHIQDEEKYNNGVALTPPMGWSSWNTFRNTIDENLIKDIADAMKKTGLLEAGYNYVNLDDCWQSSMRTDDGKLQGDLTRFPRGMKPLIEEINDMGFKVGLYTSPHLVDFRERIRVNGEVISKEYVIDFVEQHRSFFEPLHPSFFELTTAMAFNWFAMQGVDVAVIEVGLGGRLDCTNIIRWTSKN